MKKLDAEKLARHYEHWRLLISSVHPTDRVKSAAAIQKIEELTGRPRATVIHCKNPFELLMMPSLLSSCVSSKGWRKVYMDMHEKDFHSASTQELWKKYWDSLYAQILVPLLRDMLRPMRDPERWTPLVADLMETLKETLEKHLRESDANLIELEKRSTGTWCVQLEQSWTEWLAQTKLAKDKQQLVDRYQKFLLGWDTKCLLTAFSISSNTPNEFEREASLRRDLTRAIIENFGAEGRQLAHAVWVPSSLLFLAEVMEYDAASDTPIFTGSQENESSRESQILTQYLALIGNCSGYLNLESIYFVCDNPTKLELDQNGLLHNANAAAISYPGNFELYAWHGTIVPEFVIKEPKKIDHNMINKERNAAVRRAMIEQFGLGKYLQKLKAKVIHQDEFGTLYRSDAWGREPLVMVKVVNSSPEPDGTFAEYFLRVPPDIQTAQQAVAWTFGMNEQEYFPNKES